MLRRFLGGGGVDLWAEMKGKFGDLGDHLRELHTRELSEVKRQVVGLRNFLVWLEGGREK